MERRPSRAPRGSAALAAVCAIAALTGACVVDEELDVSELRDDEPAARARAQPMPAGPRHAAACADYCEAFARACDQPDAYADEGDCLATCDAWSLGEPGVLGPSVACHAALVPGTGDAFASCIAAGPDSPICGEA